MFSFIPPYPALSSQPFVSIFAWLCFCMCDCVFVVHGDAYQAVHCMACHCSVERRKLTTISGKRSQDNRREKKKRKKQGEEEKEEAPENRVWPTSNIIWRGEPTKKTKVTTKKLKIAISLKRAFPHYPVNKVCVRLESAMAEEHKMAVKTKC